MKKIIEFIRETDPEDLKDYIEGFIGFGLLFAGGYFAILIGYAAGLN